MPSPRLFASGLAAAAIAVGGAPGAAAQPEVVHPDGSGPVAWQVALVDPGNPDLFLGQFCGGAIRDALHVITAAHCVRPPDDRPGSVDVVAGVTDLKNPEPTMQRRGVAAVARAPGFTETPAGVPVNDAALITLDAPLVLTGAVAAMPPVEAGGTGAQGFLSGWGFTDLADPTSFPSALQFATIDLLPDSACAGYGSEFDPVVMLCAGRVAGSATVDSCRGDSGGPVARVTGTGAAGRPVSDRLIGITSWGRSNDGFAGCGDPTLPGVYTRVANPAINAFLTQ